MTTPFQHFERIDRHKKYTSCRPFRPMVEKLVAALEKSIKSTD